MLAILKSVIGKLSVIICANLLILGALDKIIAPIPVLGISSRFLIPAIVGIEMLLALALVIKPSNYTTSATLTLLGLFSVYTGYQIHNGAATCGCFDHVGLSRTPAVALASNLLLMLGLATTLKFKNVTRWTALGFAWLLPAFLIVSLNQVNSIRTIANLPIKTGFSSSFPGKRVILKVTPDCESCLRFTATVLAKYPKEQVAAVTLNDNQTAIKEFEQQFGIKLTLVSLEDFVKIGGVFLIPDGYEIFPETLKQLEEAKASPINIK